MALYQVEARGLVTTSRLMPSGFCPGGSGHFADAHTGTPAHLSVLVNSCRSRHSGAELPSPS